MENVIALSLGERDQAGEAVRRLRLLDEQGAIRLEAVAVVERTEAGRVAVLEQAEDVHIKATAAGGLIGGVVGLLAGPVGLLVGGATGAVIGSLVDVADAESSDDVIRSLARAVHAGSAATIAVVDERSPGPVDHLAAELGAALTRRDRRVIEAEVVEAEEAALAQRWDEEGRRSIGDRVRDVKESIAGRR